MKCELNITGRLMTAHDSQPAWCATNKYGTSFLLCDECVVAYKREHPDWKDKGVTFVALKRKEHDLVRNSDL